MSREFIESFFPTVTTLLRKLSPWIVERYFPDDVTHLCPEVVVEIVGRPIRNPILAVGAVVGILIGLGGMISLAHSDWKDVVTMKNRQTLFLLPRQRLSFALAFAFFGLMNMTALPLHNTLPAARHSTMPTAYPLWWALDCMMTGLSASALVVGSLWNYRQQNLSIHDNAAIIVRLMYPCFIGLMILAILAIIQFAWFDSTWGLELFYLIPVVGAACALWPTLLLQCMPELQDTLITKMALIVGCVITFFGGMIVLFGILFDARICTYVGQAWGDTLMAATTTFWGCDIAFIGLFLCLQQCKANSVESEAKSAGKSPQQDIGICKKLT